MKRTKLKDRALPDYTRGEELMNMITHIVGGAMGLAALVLCVVKAALSGSAIAVVAAAVYGVCMIWLYTMSSVYHGLRPGMGKKVLQVIDHCTIYTLIAGTYTPILLCAIRPMYPGIAWGLLGAEWGLALIAAGLTAVDLEIYSVFSMICYIGMGWGIVIFLPQALAALGAPALWTIFAGGVAYTVGAVLYGLGGKRRWFHSVFHLFVLLGSLLHLIAILVWVL